MGNRVYRQALDAKQAAVRDQEYAKSCDPVKVTDRTPEDAAQRLMGGRKFRRYGPFLARINGVEPGEWTPGVTRICVPSVFPEDMVTLLFEEDQRAKEALKNAPADVRGMAGVHDARRRQQAADARAQTQSSPDSDSGRGSYLDQQARASIQESEAARRARVAAAVVKRIGSANVLVPAPDGVRGFYALSDGAAAYLGGLLSRGYNSHLDPKALRFQFDPELRNLADIDRREESGSWVVRINPDSWNKLDLVYQLAVLGHEAVHAVQDLAASRATLGYRNFDEDQLGIDLQYGLSRRLKQTPLVGLSPVDPHFPLEAIATRIMYEILVIDFHAEPDTWQHLVPM